MKTAAVIIVCNGEKFITKQLDNIYNTVDEIIIAEGADKWFSKIISSRRSTDKTIELLRAYKADKDPDDKIKIIFLNTDKNSMVKEAVKQTVDSDFLYQVDIDEFIRPEDIAWSFKVLEKGGCQTVGVPQRWYYKYHDAYLVGGRPRGVRECPVRFFKNRAKQKVYPSHIPWGGYYNEAGTHMGASFTNIPHGYSYHYLSLFREQLEMKMKYYVLRDKVNPQIMIDRLADFDKTTRASIGGMIPSYGSKLLLEENPFITF